MFIRKKSMSGGRRTAVQLVKSERTGTRVRQSILQHIGNVASEDAAGLEALVREAERVRDQRLYSKKMPVLPPEEGILAKLAQPDPQERGSYGVDAASLDLEQVVATGIHQAYGAVYRELELDRLLPPVRYRASSRALCHTVMARLAKPGSEHDNARTLEKRLSVPMPLERIYRTMDHLNADRIGRLKCLASRRAAGVAPEPVDVLFLDCTSMCCESFNVDGLRQTDCTEDDKRSETQVLLALVVTAEGLPVTYELVPGTSFEGKSLVPALKNLCRSIPARQACVIADRGMMSAGNLKELEQAGFHFVTGARLLSQPKNRQEEWVPEGVGQKLADGGRLVELPEGEGRRLIAHWSPKRAREDARNRDRLLNKLEKKLASGNPGKAIVPSCAERTILRQTGSEQFEIDAERVRDAQRLDGWHGVITTLPNSDALQVIGCYDGLCQMEAAFRICLRDAQIRPMFHWTETRIHAHVAIAFMTLMCVRHLQHRLRLRGRSWPAEGIQKALMEIECAVLRDSRSGRRFLYPPVLTPEAREIFLALKLKPPRAPRELT